MKAGQQRDCRVARELEAALRAAVPTRRATGAAATRLLGAAASIALIAALMAAPLPAWAAVTDYPDGSNDSTPIVLADSSTQLQVLTGSATQSGVISESGGSWSLEKTGAGTLIFTRANIYTGGTTITAGTLQIGNGSTTGSIAGDIVDNAALVFNRSNTITFNGAISGSGSLTQSGSGTLILAGTNSYSGGTLITGGGTVQAAADANFGDKNGSLTFDNGILKLADSFNLAGTFNVPAGGVRTITINSGGATIDTNGFSTSLGQNIDGVGGLTKTGEGYLFLSGADTYSGGTTVNGGVLQIAGSLASAGALTVNGGQLDLTSPTLAVGALSGAGGLITLEGTLITSSASNTTLSSVISSTGGLVKNSSGTLTLLGANSYTGGTTITAGTLQIGNGGTTGSIVGDIVDNAALVFNRSNTLQYAGSISGTGLVAVNSGVVVLSGTNSYSGGTTIATGATLRLGNSGATGTITGDVQADGVLQFSRSGTTVFSGQISGTGQIVQTTGATIFSGNNTYTGMTFLVGGTMQIGNGGTTGSIAGDISVDNAILAFNRSDTVTFGGAISGSGFGLTQAGTGTLILTADNTLLGTTRINTGTLQLGNGGTTGSIRGNVEDNGTLIFNRSDNITFGGSIAGTGSLTKSGSGTLTLTGLAINISSTTISAGTLQIGNGGSAGSQIGDVIDNDTLVFDLNGVLFQGAISGSGSVVHAGSNTTIITGAGTYTGGTTISSGTLQIGSTSFNGGTTGSISGNILDNSALVFNRSDTITFGGDISGTGSLTQSGSGTLILTGTSTVPVTISAGTLGGSGTVGAVTVASGAVLAPGTGVGTLHVSGNLSLASGAAYDVDVSATTADLSSIAGTASLTGSLVFAQTAASYIPNTTYTLLTAAGGLAGTFTSVDFGAGFGANVHAAVSYDAQNVYLTLAPAGTVSWSATPASDDWNTATNWQAGVVPGDLDVAIFAGTTQTAIAITAPATAQLLQFDAGAPAYSFAIVGGSLTLQNGIQDNSSNRPSLTVDGGGSLIVAGNNTADAILTANASGIISFTGAADAGRDTALIGAGGTFDFSGTTGPNGDGKVQAGSISGDGSIFLGSDALTTGGDNASTTFSGVIADGGAQGGTGASLNKIGSGTLTLTGANTYTGVTTITAGTLQVGSATALSAAAAIVNGTLDLNDYSIALANISGSGIVDNTGGSGITLTVGGDNQDSVYSGVLQNSGGATLDLVKTGTGALTLSGASTYYGNTTLSGGTLVVGVDTVGAISSSAIGTGTLTLNGGTLSTNGNFTLANSVSLTAGSTIDTAGHTLTLSGYIDDGGSLIGLTKTGAGTLVLSYGGNFWGGTTTISAGTVRQDADYALSSVTTVDIATGAKVDYADHAIAFYGLSGTGTVTNSGSVGTEISIGSPFNPDPISFGGVIEDGAGGGVTSVRFDYANVVTFTGANTYTGGTYISGGCGCSSSTLILGDGGSLAGDITVDGRLVFDKSTNFTSDNLIDGSGLVQKLGAGTLTLTAANLYGSGTIISAGTVEVGNDTALAFGDVIMAAGTTLSFKAGADYSIVNSIALADGAGSTISVADGDTSEISGALYDGAPLGVLNKAGAGTLTLSGGNSFSGGLFLDAGTLEIGNDDALGYGDLTMAAGTVLAFQGGGNFSVGNNVTINGAATVSVAGTDESELYGVISDGGAPGTLIKTGSGTLILSNAVPNTYTGGTAINGGVLQVSYDDSLGDAAGGISFGSGGTLQLGNYFDTARAITLNTGGGQIDVNGYSSEMSGVITGNGGLSVKDSYGGGSLYLTGGNNYTGGTTISDGATVMIDADSGLGASTGGVTLDNGALVFFSSLTMAAARTVTLGPGGGVIVIAAPSEIASTITGSGALTVLGGPLTLSGTNDYSGGTYITGGEIVITRDANLGAAAGGVSIDQGYLTFGADVTLNASRTFTMANSGGAFDTNGHDAVVLGDITGAGSFIVLGNGDPLTSGSLTVVTDITNTGDTYIDGGILRLGNGGTTGSLQPGTVFNDGTLVFDRSDTVSFSNDIVASCGCFVGNVVKDGAGTVILSGNNSYTGATTVDRGTLLVASALALPSTTDVAVSTGATLQLGDGLNFSIQTLSDGTGGSGSVPASVVIGVSDPNSSLSITGGSGTNTFSGQITGPGTLLFSGSGTWVLAGAGSDIGNGFDVGSFSSPGTTGALNITGSLNSSGTTIVLDGALMVSNGGTLTSGSTAIVSGATGAAPSVTVTGAGSTWNITGGLSLGSVFGPAISTVTVADGGTLRITTNNLLNIDAVGVLNIGSGGSAGTLDVPGIQNNGQINANFSGSATLAAGISGSGAITIALVNPASQLTLSGINNYSGDTNLDDGTLKVTNGSALGNSTLKMAAGTTLLVQNSFGGVGNNIVLNGDATFNVTGVTIAASGIISGAGLTKAGDGTLVLLAANTYTGATIVSAGTLTMGVDSALSSSTAVTVASGATLDVNGLQLQTGSLSGAGDVLLGGGTLRTGNDNADSSFGGRVSGDGTFTKNGSGILTLAGSIDLPTQGGSNVFQVNNGTLSVSAGGSVTADVVQNFATIENAGTITTDAVLQTFGAMTNSGEIVGATQNFSDFINTGTMGSLSSLGGTAENSGTINGNVQNFVSFASTGIINGDIGNFATAALEGQANGQLSNVTVGATVTLTGTLTGLTAYQGAGGSTFDLAGFDTTAGGVSGAGDVLLGGATLTIAAANPFTFSGVISGSGNLVKTGTDTQTLSGINSYTGTTTISGGTLVVGFGGALGAGDVIDNATLQIDNPGAFANNISGSGGLVSTTDVQLTGTVSYAGTTTIQGGTLDISGSSGTFGGGDIVNDGSLNFSRTADMVLAGNISGSGTLVMNSAGVTLTLTGDNTYTGVTTNYGTLQVGDGGETGSIAGDITNNGALVFNRRGSLTYAGTISGYGSVTVAGSGTVIFTGENLYSDTTTISGGTLRLANGQAAGSGSVALGATLSLADEVDFSNTIYVNGAAAAVEVRSGESATYSGAIYENSGASVLTKQGGGDLVLNGVTYNTGETVVAAGTLYVNGNIINSSGITVNNGATLGGSGSVTSVTVHSGGALSPGAAPGDIATLTINGNLRTESGSALGIEVADFGADQIHVTGDATLGGSVFANFASGLNLPRTPTIYTLITADGLLSGAFDGLNTLSVPTHYGATLSYDSQHAFLTIALLDNVWLATPVDSRFTNDANWSFGEMPQSDQAAVFGSSSITSVALSAEDVSLTGLIFRSGASAYSIAIDGTAAGDASLTLSNGGIVNESGNAQSITVSGTDGGTGTLVIAGGNAADSRLTANGGGSILFTGTSDAGAGAVLTANAGGTISFENTSGTASDYQVAAGSIAGAGTFALGNSTLTTGALNTSTTVSGEITSYGGGLVKVGTGTLTLTGANSYTGTTTISGGTLALAGAGQITGVVIADATFDISAADAAVSIDGLGGSGQVALGDQTLIIGGYSGTAFSGSIGGTGGLSVDGGLTLLGATTYTGGTAVNGSLTVGDATHTVQLVGLVTSYGSTSFVNADFSAMTGLVTRGGSTSIMGASNIGGLSVTNASFTQFQDSSSAGTATIVNESGFTEFQGDSTAASANITINGGFLFFQDNATAANATITNNVFAYFYDNSSAGSAVIGGSNTVDFWNSSTAANATFNTGASFHDTSDGGSATFNSDVDFSDTAGAGNDHKVSAGAISGDGTVSLGANQLTVGGTNLDMAFAGQITGDGSVVKAGTGTLTLSGSNSYTGSTTINGGTLALVGAGSIAPSDVINNTVFDISATDSGATVNSLTGAGAVLLGAQTLTLSNGGNISGIISGADGGLAMDGGTLTLAGIHTYTGATTIDAGTLVLLNASGISASSGVAADGTFDISAAGASIKTLSGGGFVTLGSHNLTITDGSGVFSGIISGTGSVVVAGGTLNLTGQNTYSGGTSVSGLLSLGSGGSAGSGPITTTGSVLDYGNGVTVNNPIIVNSNTTQLQTLAGVTATQAGVISELGGSRPLEKTGAGTLILTGANTYSGVTTVSAGTLAVNSSIAASSGVTVAAAGTLGGVGTVASTTIQSGGTLAPGNAIGTLNVAGNLTLSAGSTYAFEMSNLANDLVLVSGNVSLAGTLSASFLSTSFGTGNTYTVLTTTGLLSGTFDGLVTSSLPQYLTSLSYDAHNIYLTLTPTDYIWSSTPVSTDWNSGSNWKYGLVPGAGDIAQFDASNAASVVVSQAASARVLQFNAGAPAYVLAVTGSASGAASLTLSQGITNASATAPGITVSGVSAGTGTLAFTGTGNAANAVITAGSFGTVSFAGNTDAGAAARLTANAGGTITFAATSGANGDSQVSAGGIAGAGNFLLGANTLTVGALNSTTEVSGVISGTGALIKTGTGTLILSGASTYTGTTTVNSGILAVNGSIASNVALTGGTLQGSGRVGAVTAASGTVVAPGNSIGTLSVAGISFASGAAYQVETNSAGAADLLNATGSASLNGAVQILAASGNYAPVTSYRILNATGGVNGAFASVTSNQANLAPTLLYSTNAVDLRLMRTDVQFGTSYGATANQIAAGSAVSAGGSGSALYGALANAYAPGTINATLDSLSGEIHAAVRGAMLENSRVIRNAVLDRLATAGEGTGAWAQGFADFGWLDGDGNAAKTQRNNTGFVAGVDTRVGDGLRLGLGGAYGGSKVSITARGSSATGSNGSLIGYVSWRSGAIALSLGGDYGWGDTDVTRAITAFAETAQSRRSNTTGEVFAEARYDLQLSSVSLVPYLDLAHVTAWTGAFTETGGLSALSGAAASFSQTYSTLGARANVGDFDFDGMTATPRLGLGWSHTFDAAAPGETLNFRGTGSSFAVMSAPLGQDAAAIDLGLDLALTPQALIRLGYDGNFSSRGQSHTIHGGLDWKF